MKHMNESIQEFKILAEIKTRAIRAIRQDESEREECLSMGLDDAARCAYHSAESFRRVLEWIEELKISMGAMN
jgi:hypothetical protein